MKENRVKTKKIQTTTSMELSSIPDLSFEQSLAELERMVGEA